MRRTASRIWRWCVALGAVALLAGCGTATASTPAAPGSGNATAQSGMHTRRGFFGGGLNLQAIANLLHISVDTLRQDLQSGESILDVAKKQGVSEQTLENHLVSTYRTRLNQMVQSGRITSDQAQQMLNRYQQMLPNLLARKGLPAPPAGRPGGNWTGGAAGGGWSGGAAGGAGGSGGLGGSGM